MILSPVRKASGRFEQLSRFNKAIILRIVGHIIRDNITETAGDSRAAQNCRDSDVRPNA